MSLEARYADGQLAALRFLKLAFPTATHPVVQNSAVLQSQPTKDVTPEAKKQLEPPTTPFAVSQLFDVHEQGKTRVEPRRKLSAEDMCTSCRKQKHYGNCKRPIAIKRSDFNMGLKGDDPSRSDVPSTSTNYQSATTADSSMARAQDGRPADEQAASGFADLFRHLGVTSVADEPGRMYGGLNKTSSAIEDLLRARRAVILERMYGASKLSGWQLPGSETHSMHEQRGPSPNPYEERRTVLSPPVGWGPEADQRIQQAFGQIDNAADSTNIGGGSGTPSGGPAVLA